MKRIQSFIQKTCKEKNVIPLYYAESGSRLWGFHSEDSDFDIRGIHLVSQKDYFRLDRPNEVVEVLDGDLDLVSFSLDKAFSLLANSNPSLLEWFRGDIVYLNNFKGYKKLKEEVLKEINLKALFWHYVSMGKQNYVKYVEKDKQYTYKKVLYVLRGLLSADFIYQKKQIPPLDFEDLVEKLAFEKKIEKLLKEILRKKKERTEKDLVENKEEVLKVVKKFFEKVSTEDVEPTGNKHKLWEILNTYSVKIKEEHYRIAH